MTCNRPPPPAFLQSGSGGAILLGSSVDRVTISVSRFDSNEANGDGGAVAFKTDREEIGKTTARVLVRGVVESP